VNEKLTIGVNVKPLLGHAAFGSKIDRLQLNVRDQHMDLDAKGNFYSSLPVDIHLNAESKIDSVTFSDFENYTERDWINNSFAFGNPGIAFDLGASYQINERLTVSAALNNLGFISWKNDLNKLSFNSNSSFDRVVTDDREMIIDLLDSIANSIIYDVRHDKFKTALTPVLHAGVEYHLTKSVSFGLLSRSTFWKNDFRQSFNLSFNLQPYSFVSFNAGATYQVKGNFNLCGGFMFLLGPLQFHILVDNAPVYYSSFIDGGDKYSLPDRMKSFTERTGVNLIFGRHGYVNKPMLDRGKGSWN
jgi:hypothetical protein